MIEFGPHLVASPTGTLRRALIVMPTRAIEDARPLPGEPNAVEPRARNELAVLAKTLRYFGCDVVELQSASADPLASSVVDLAVVFESGAALLRPYGMKRRSEASWLEQEFVKLDVPIAGHIEGPGLLNGSDVVFAGKRAFIGVSPRSNAFGRNGFARIAQAHGFEPIEVQLDPAVPSLRSICGVLSDTQVVLATEKLDREAFKDLSVIAVTRGDELGAGVLNIGERHVLADVRFPRVIDGLRDSGTRVEAIDLYNFGRIGLTPSTLVLDIRRAQ